MAHSLLVLAWLCFGLVSWTCGASGVSEVAVDARGETLSSTERIQLESPEAQQNQFDNERESGNAYEPTCQPTKLDSLHIELEEVETMIELQVKRLSILKSLRSRYLTADTDIDERIPLKGDLIERKLRLLEDSAFEESTKRNTESLIVKKAKLTLAAPLTGAFVVKRPPKSIIKARELIVIITAIGEVQILEPPRQLIVRAQIAVTEVDRVVLDLDAPDPFLAVVSKASKRLSVFPFHEITKSSLGETVQPLSVIDLSSTPNDLFKSMSVRRSAIGLLHTDGLVQFLSLNGSVIHELVTESPSGQATAKRNALAVASGPNIVYSILTKTAARNTQVCSGTMSDISAIEYEPRNQHIIYSGTKDGDLLVHAVNQLQEGASDEKACTLLERFALGTPRLDPIQKLYRTKSGHLLVATSQYIIVLKVQFEGQLSLKLEVLARSLLGSLSGHPISTMSVVESGLNTYIGVSRGPSQKPHEFFLLQVLLRAEPQQSDYPALTYVSFGGVVLVLILAKVCWSRQPVNGQSQWMERDNILRERLEKLSSNELTMNSKLRGHYQESYESVSQELKERIEQARRETLECAFSE